MALENWLFYCSITFIAVITPGPAILLIMSQSLQFGPKRTLFSIGGNITGLLILATGSVLGLSTLLLVSATAFTLVKFIGAAYLIYLGIKLWRKGVAPTTPQLEQPSTKRGYKLYLQGVLIAVTNPKAIAFTTALFPQFIDASKPLAIQFTILVATFMSFSVISLFSYALISHHARNRSKRAFSSHLIGKLFGATFVGAGTLLALSSQK